MTSSGAPPPCRTCAPPLSALRTSRCESRTAAATSRVTSSGAPPPCRTCAPHRVSVTLSYLCGPPCALQRVRLPHRVVLVHPTVCHTCAAHRVGTARPPCALQRVRLPHRVVLARPTVCGPPCRTCAAHRDGAARPTVCAPTGAPYRDGTACCQHRPLGSNCGRCSSRAVRCQLRRCVARGALLGAPHCARTLRCPPPTDSSE